MSTPPPPSQPPSGGFGAPQDPAPGGFAPPPPSMPPAPPQQPPAQPAYGYPQQPGAGYGYPQQPGTPPPFGPPTTPMHTAQPPAGGSGGGGNDVRNQLMIVGAALLAIVLIVGGGFWYVSGDGDGKKDTADGGPAKPGDDKAQAGAGGTEKVPANTKSKVLLNQPSPTPEEMVQVPGSWLTDSTYVKSDVFKIVGYNLVDGGKKWEVPLPGEICGATPHVSDKKSAVIFRPTKATPEVKYPPCTEVGVIDLEAGKLLWTGNAKSATSGDKPVQYNEVTLSGQTVAAGGTSGGAAWNLTDGKSLWLPKTDAEGCYDAATPAARPSPSCASAARAATRPCTRRSSTRPPARRSPRTSSPRASNTPASSPPSR